MELSSKFSLYDVLAMIIPGGIIIAAVTIWIQPDWFNSEDIMCCGRKIIVNNDLTILQSIILLCAAYIIGLVNNWINDGIFRGFRNFQQAIKNELLKVIRENGSINLKEFVGSKYVQSKERYKCLACICVCTIVKIICELFRCRCGYKEEHNEIEYYKAYYALAWHGKLGSVPLIESQVALLRNILLPLIGLSIALSGNWICCCAVIILLYAVMIQRQNKVYQLVWEAANYYKL